MPLRHSFSSFLFLPNTLCKLFFEKVFKEFIAEQGISLGVSTWLIYQNLREKVFLLKLFAKVRRVNLTAGRTGMMGHLAR